MSAVKRIRPASHLALVEGVRGFRLVVTPGRGETFGVTLEETYGENGSTITAPVSTATPIQSGRVVDALFVAIRKAGHQPSVLCFYLIIIESIFFEMILYKICCLFIQLYPWRLAKFVCAHLPTMLCIHI